jgi:hypothetical protein
MLMWIMTTTGFYSVVQKAEDVANGTVSVRARVRADLDGLRAYLPSMGDIIETDDSDYRYRVIAPHEAFAAAVAAMASDIDYDNFKSVVAERQGEDRANVYGNVWAALLTLQKADPKHEPPIAIDAYPTHGSHSRTR